MKIDSHIHINFQNMDINNLVEYMNSNAIDKCWALTWEEMSPAVPKLYKSLPIEKVMKAYNEYPNRFIPMYAPDPYKDNIYSILKEYKYKGVKGCGELKTPLDWQSIKIQRLLTGLNQLDMPLVFHMEQRTYRYIPNKNNLLDSFINKVVESKIFNGSPRRILEIINRYKIKSTIKLRKNIVYFPGYLNDFVGLEKRVNEFNEVIFIGHGPLFWKNIASDYPFYSKHGRGKVTKEGIICDLLKKYDNFYADLSGTSGFKALKRDKTFAKKFLEKFYKKILFGTDNYKLGLEELIISLNLPQKKLKYIFGLNANNILRRSNKN